MGEPNNRILVRMLERLFAGLESGPNLNCRPHSSRQRVDFLQAQKLLDLAPEEALQRLLGKGRKVTLTARATAPRRNANGGRSRSAGERTTADGETRPEEQPAAVELSPQERAEQQAWDDQQAFLRKLRIVADDARTYEQDTGAHVLNIGFPLLSLPPGSAGIAGSASGRGGTKRILAPVAFIPVTITLRSGVNPTIEVACQSDGSDRIVPNTALLAWLERQTGQAADDLFHDDEGDQPWREIAEITRFVADTLKLPVPEVFAQLWEAGGVRGQKSEVRDQKSEVRGRKAGGRKEPGGAVPADSQRPTTDNGPRPTDHLQLQSAPRADEGEPPRIVPAAVLGLFPMNNQGLLRDMQAMVGGEALDGPVASFIDVNVRLDQADEDVSYDHEAWSGERRPRVVKQERMVTLCDPCQSRAVRLARDCRGLVVHGPPGTGKSQTITNIIGDHLARGERVLMVCDKRTALDVVANRLEHMGLGSLCALIHDPQRDQRDLYRTIREQLEALTDTPTDPRAAGKLAKIDRELKKLHRELTECWSLLMEPEAGTQLSFHDLVGEWLALSAAADTEFDPSSLSQARLSELEQCERELRDLFVRAEQVEFAENSWTHAAGLTLRDFLARPMKDIRSGMERCLASARALDATFDESIPPFDVAIDLPPLDAQAEARTRLARHLKRVFEIDPAVLNRWARRDAQAVRRARQRLKELQPHLDTLHAGPLDAELSLLTAGERPNPAHISQQLTALEDWLAVASKWYGLVFLKRRARAAEVVSRYGLALSVETAQRVRNYLIGLRARLILATVHRELLGESADAGGLPGDDLLDRSLSDHAALFEVLIAVRNMPSLSGLAEPVIEALVEPDRRPALLRGLEKSPARAAALTQVATILTVSKLFDVRWIIEVLNNWSAGRSRRTASTSRRTDFQSVRLEAAVEDSDGLEIRSTETGGSDGLEIRPTAMAHAAEVFEELQDRLDTLEGVLRVRDELAKLPASLQAGAAALLERSLDADTSLDTLRRGVLTAEVTARLRDNPKLQALDAQRLQSSFARCAELDREKQTLVRDTLLHLWVDRQKQRLLVGTGSRLNSTGADLRRRLTMRGERAMRLRQVVAVGQGIDGGDPLFDLRPVWMASPETVAQVFPRGPLFDVVIFDEASQCRLEEALPVLTRAKRVVIAGDPKQLPPTRFFESAITVSEDDEPETDQELFEMHQSEIEDLLGAALSLDIQQCYLDVHYRSRNADLIEFSNQQFYSSRLQPIPGHPANRARFSPITLYRAGGLYEERTNVAEAEQVCRIVRDLLRRAEPPSIGIACFNLTQRDLIVEKLDELAGEDDEFARRLAKARTRIGEGSFEGLFVKNLENVQGDERDHIIISTTYGPDRQGRFYRRFGPLGRVGGGRRLNVLVTRAREELHLVTSVPAEAYRRLPPIPPGQTPTGGWLLFAFLAFAEQLADAYEETHHALEEEQAAREPVVHVRPSDAPSRFAEALAERLAREHRVGGDVHWGNDGFCIDLALHHPHRPEKVTIGLLCDGVRFTQAEDPIEWDLFRTAVLESQGWKLHRLWTPHFFRDPEGTIRSLLREVFARADRGRPAE